MSYTLRIRKSGKRVYEIRVSRGRDPDTGKQLTPYTMTWEVPETYSAKRAEREAAAIEGKFKADCKAGKVLTKQEERTQKKERKERARLEALEEEKKPTFSQFLETFGKVREMQGIAATTRWRDGQILNFAAETFGDTKIDAITKGMMSKYLMEIQEKHNYKSGTMNNIYAKLKVFFDMAVEHGIIEQSPMNGLKRPRKSKDEIEADRALHKAYDEKEVAYILKCAAREPLKWHTLIVFALDTGCRRGEIAGLKWENINLETGEVNICNNRVHICNKGTFDTSPKTGRNRTVLLTAQALSILKQWHREQILEMFKNGMKSEYVFTEVHSTKGIQPGVITDYFDTFGKRYKIENFHPHALRHTMATLSIANGADVVSVSKKLGHANTAITLNVYSHANAEAQKRANDILANAIYKDAETDKRKAQGE